MILRLNHFLFVFTAQNIGMFCLRMLTLGLLLLIVSCSPTKSIVLQTMEPSPVHISKNIKRIGIINRSQPTDKVKDDTGIYSVVAVEEQWLEEKGRSAALTGLFQKLLKDSRFQSIHILDSIPQELMDFEIENDSISWAMIEDICNTYDVDAVFSMSFFDTETKVSLKKTSMIQPNLMRVKVKVQAQEITLETLIENGWRIYYPKGKEIIDEFVLNNQIVSTGKGENPWEAYRAIEGRRDTLVKQSKVAGSNYGLRLLPYEDSVERLYYARGSQNLDLAHTFIKSGDWQGAFQLWEKELENSNPNIVGRACFNMAVRYEINGDLNRAMEWASKSQLDYHNKKALAYLDQLQYRFSQNQILEQQLPK